MAQDKRLSATRCLGRNNMPSIGPVHMPRFFFLPEGTAGYAEDED
ncbi:MAG: hypothetical protein HONBIEJF_00016 [Fimbriimonadaceae bacterium]|nr:hypothetical protein [Fimbriimonadaceae bacterium]